MTDIEHNRLSNKYSQMTDENLLVEVIQNKNNVLSEKICYNIIGRK